MSWHFLTNKYYNTIRIENNFLQTQEFSGIYISEVFETLLVHSSDNDCVLVVDLENRLIDVTSHKNESELISYFSNFVATFYEIHSQINNEI